MNRDFLESHEIAGHPDLAVRVRGALLDGDSPNRIMGWEDLSRSKFAEILAGPVPDIISSDLRHITGMRGIWINQKSQGALLSGSGEPFAFIILLVPHRMTGRTMLRGLRNIRNQLRERANRDFDFGAVAEAVPLLPLLRLVHNRGYPAWEIRADGAVSEYDGRFAPLINDPTAPAADAGPKHSPE